MSTTTTAPTEPKHACHVTEDGTHYPPETPDQLVRVLEEARREGTRILIRYGDRVTGRDWLEEHDIMGRLGRSTGPCKIPILLQRTDSTGGSGILAASIVKVAKAKAPKRLLWKHEHYNHPKLTLRHAHKYGLKAQILAGGQDHARFKTANDARRWAKRLDLMLEEATL